MKNASMKKYRPVLVSEVVHRQLKTLAYQQDTSVRALTDAAVVAFYELVGEERGVTQLGKLSEDAVIAA